MKQKGTSGTKADQHSFSPLLGLLAALLVLTLLTGSIVIILYSYRGASPSSVSQPQLNVYVTDRGSLYKLDARYGRLLWRYKIGSDIVNFEAVDNIVYISSSGGNIYALNANNGSLSWLKRIDNSDIVVVVNGTFFTEDGAAIYALNAKNGTLKWQHGGFISPQILAVANGFVYVKAGQNTLSALDTRNGAVRWHFQEAGSPFGQTIFGILIDNVIYDAASNCLYAINALNGELIWQSQIAGPLSFKAIQVAHGTIYASSTLFSQAFLQNQNDVYNHEFVFAFNIKNGSRIWNSARGYNLDPSIQPTGSIVFATFDQDYSNGLYGLSTKDGTLRWTFKDGCGSDSKCNVVPLGIVGSVLYMIGLDGHINKITAVDATSGTISWQKTVSYYSDTFTTINNGTIYLLSVIASNAGHDTIVALKLADASTLWSYQLADANTPLNLRFPPCIFLAS